VSDVISPGIPELLKYI